MPCRKEVWLPWDYHAVGRTSPVERPQKRPWGGGRRVTVNLQSPMPPSDPATSAKADPLCGSEISCPARPSLIPDS